MFDLGLLTVPLLSLLAVFGFAVVTDVNMIAFDVTVVPTMARDMGFDPNNIRDTVMYKIYTIANVAETSRGVSYSTISDMRHQSLKNISEILRIQDGVIAAQGLLGLIPYRIKGKLMQEGDTLYLVLVGFSSDGGSFNLTLKSDIPVFDSAQLIQGRAGFLGGSKDPNNLNTKLITANADIEIRSLLNRAAEAIVDRIDPYLLARYYFVLESPTATFTKAIPQLTRCMDVLPKQQQIWPLVLWGRVYHEQGKYDKAIEIYQEVVRLAPFFPFAYLRWGESLASGSKHQQAIEMYQKAVINSRYYPNYPIARSAAYNLWADSLIAMGKLDQAERVLRKGVDAFYFANEQSPANALSNNALGKFLLYHRKDYFNAEYYLRRAVYMDSEPKYYALLQEAVAKRVPGYAEHIMPTETTEPNSKPVEELPPPENDKAVSGLMYMLPSLQITN